MISLPSVLPYIRIGSSSLALCEPEWLSDTLRNAADGTDVPEWIVSDISRGVESFLANHYKGCYIDSSDLFERIEKALSSIGLSRIAERMDRTPPPMRVSLSDLARRAGTGYELGFFHLLGEALQSAASGGACRIELHGLRSAVRRLVGAKKWTERCESLQRLIVSFIQQKETTARTAYPDFRLIIAQ